MKCKVCNHEFSKWDKEHDYGHHHICGACREDAARAVREAKEAFYGRNDDESMG